MLAMMPEADSLDAVFTSVRNCAASVTEERWTSTC